MPGIYFDGRPGGSFPTPNLQGVILANSLSGVGTPPACALFDGDFVVTTINSTLNTPQTTTPVLRMLLPADKTAHYKEGTPVAGILGVAFDDVQTTSVGAATSPPAYGGITTGAGIPYPYSYSGLMGNDKATARAFERVAIATSGMYFTGRIDMNATNWPSGLTLADQFNGQPAGIVLNYTQYTLTFSGASTINVSGQVTASMTTTTTAAVAQAAFQALALPNASSITVTGTTGGPLVVTFPNPVYVFATTGGNVTLTVQGQCQYTIQPGTGVGGITSGAAALDSCLIILGPEATDPLYNTLVAANAPTGPLVRFYVAGSFQQSLTGVQYSTQ